MDLRLSLLDGSVHVLYHLRIFDVVVIASCDYDFRVVVVVHLFGSCVSHWDLLEVFDYCVNASLIVEGNLRIGYVE